MKRQAKEPLILVLDAILFYCALFYLLPYFFRDALLWPGLPQFYFLLMSGWICWQQKIAFNDIGWRAMHPWQELAIVLIVATVPLLVVLVGAWQMELEWAATTSTQGMALASWLILVVLAPVAEEFFFRGLLARFLLKKISPHATVLLTSLVFAAVHFRWQPGPLLLGLATTTLYVWRRNLIAATLLHAICNAIGPLLQLYWPELYRAFALFFLA